MILSQALCNTEKQAIRAALQEYRNTIYERNLVEIKYYVQSVIEQRSPPDCSEENANSLRLDALKNEIFAYGIPEWIKTPSDLLKKENLESLRESLELDGIQPIPDNETREAYFARRENYLSILDDELRKETIFEYQGTLSVPPDLRYLMELFDAVTGPGLGQYRYTEGYTFLSSQTCNNGSEECDIRERVYKLNRKGKLKWPAFYTERWEAAAGFRCGNWANGPGGGFALFCRSEDEGLPWAWRYGLELIQDTSDHLYDDISNFLKSYAHFEETFLNMFYAPRCFW